MAFVLVDKESFTNRTTNIDNSISCSTKSVAYHIICHQSKFCCVLQVSQLHYQALNDASWSKDGHLVVVCSTDGYCSLIHFAHGELGAFYRGTFGAPNPQPVAVENNVSELDKCLSNDVEMLPSKTAADTNNGTVKEADNSPKTNLSPTSVPNSNKPTTEAKLSEPCSTNNPTVVDSTTAASKPKRRVQLTTLVSFVDGNITGNNRTDDSHNSTNLSVDPNVHSTKHISQKICEKDVIELTDDSTSQPMV
ncbi:unnamed protein product [Schistosoma turkestanicum]|nr:unnamed protein product [Schistosoma turkestanicum]